MKALRGWAIYGLLLALAAATAVATRQSRGSESKVPSIDNPGPMGAKALRTYLEEGGHPVIVHRQPLSSLPRGARTLVIAAPSARKVGEAEVREIEAFVHAGGTLVYLADREHSQPHLDAWLELEAGPRLTPDSLLSEVLSDLGGTSVSVALPLGAAHGLERLRVSADTTLRVGKAPPAAPEARAAVPVAEGALWWTGLGQGEIWIGAGADLIENRRLELESNLGFWENLAARGPLVFDEYHHRAGAAPPMSLAFVAFGLQLLAFTVVLTFAKGSRLGPARPVLTERHRGSLEYLASLAHLTRRARVERELVLELPTRLRLLMQERLGIGVTLSEHEAALELERRCRLPAAHTEALLSEARSAAAGEVGPALYSRLSRDFARIERVITGRARR